ncbi:MAG: hypothetical protein KAR20_09380, partial [Candidatus Heimdallarchaeota archaeon]|nr:hypothetical protein [Candidatus Heimdallarchaeota archaeon]
MKKKLNVQKTGVLIILALAIIFITGQFFSVIQEPPHITHTSTLDSFSAPYYGWSLPNYVDPKGAPAYFEKSSHIEKNIIFDSNIDWSNVYKVSSTI